MSQQASSKNPTDLEIMMYLDGELSEADGKLVERWLAEDSEAAVKASSIRQMGEMLRTSVELEADAAEAKLAGLWSAIDTSIHANGYSQGGHSKGATSSAAQADASATAVAMQAEKRATDALVAKSSWFSGWQGHVTTGALVAAAVAVLMFVTRPERIVETTTVVKQGSSQTMALPVALKSQQPEVEELEVYNGTGIIMTVHGDAPDSGDDDSSAVIWISNDTDVVEEPI